MPSFSTPAYSPNRSLVWPNSFYYLRTDSGGQNLAGTVTTALTNTAAYHAARTNGELFRFEPFGPDEWTYSGENPLAFTPPVTAGYFQDVWPGGTPSKTNWTISYPAGSNGTSHLYFGNLRQENAYDFFGNYQANNDGGTDRHAVLWAESVAYGRELVEAYNYTGTSATAAQVVTYDLTNYTLPNGPSEPAGVVAARIPVAPFQFTYADLVAAGTGDLGHMIGWVAANYENAYQWPARRDDGELVGNYLKAGSVIRLKSSWTIPSGWPATLKALARTLQRYGAVLFDKNSKTTYPISKGKAVISSVSDASWPTGGANLGNLWNAAGPSLSDFEEVDISAYKVANNSIEVSTSVSKTFRQVPASPANGFTTDITLTGFRAVVSNPASGFTRDESLINLVSPPGNPASGFTTDITLTSFVKTLGNPASGFTTDGNAIFTKFPSTPGNPANGWSFGPIIKSISPTSGTTDGGTLVTITGEEFTGAILVRFDSTDVTPVSVTSTTVTAYTPPHVTGLVDVRVQGRPGLPLDSMVTPLSVYGKYAYTTTTVVSSISPTEGPVGQSVVVTGVGFTDATQVLFGSAPATYVVNSDTQITATVPTGTGQVHVQVVGLGGPSATTSADLFTYVIRPAITSITPNTGPAVGGTSVTINGTGFTDVTRVVFDGIDATSVTVVNDTTITCVSPRHDTVSTATVRAITSDDVYSTTNGQFIYTNQIPIAFASATPTSGRAPFNVSFSSAGSYDVEGGAITYAWNFGDGSSSSGLASPTHTFTTAGTYIVKLTVYDQSDAPSAETNDSKVTITVAEPNPNVLPVAVATASPTSGIGPLNVSFTGINSYDLDGTIVSYSWDFGDGSSLSTSPNPTHIYNTVDTFTATLTVTDNSGGTDTATVQATVTGLPPVIIPTITNVSPSEGPITGNTIVTLTGTGFAGVTSVKFGSTSATIVEISSDTRMLVRSPAGSGNVNITASTSSGTSSSVATFNYRTLPIVTSVTPNTGPSIGGTAVTISGSDLTTVSKVFFGNTEASSVVVEDDGTVTAISPRTNAVGQVRVTVYSTIRGTSVNDVYFTYNNQKPIAIASASVTSGTALLSVVFNSDDSYDPDGDYLSYSWNFGDGYSTTIANPTHVFSSAGVYTVKLTVYDAANLASEETEESQVTITVDGPVGNQDPVAIASADVTSGPVPLSVQFTGDQSIDPDGKVVFYYWQFGDGYSYQAINPLHKYTTAGTYYATLRVYDDKGTKTTSSPIEINVGSVDPGDYVRPVVASITPNTGSSKGGDAIRLEGEHFNSATSVIFSPVDGDPTEGGEATILRLVSDNRMTVTSPPGVGEVDVIVSNPAGHSQRFDGSKFTYFTPPTVKITATPKSGPAPLTVSFSSAGSSGFGSITSYYWDFGDGSLLDFSDNNTSNEANPTHVFTAPGSYMVTLYIQDSRGIVGKATTSISATQTIGFPGGSGGGGGGGGPGGSGGSGGGGWWYPPDIEPPEVEPPIYLNSSCTLYYTHVAGGWYTFGQLDPDGFEPSFSEEWKIQRTKVGITFRLTITALKDINADGLFIGALSITSDGNFTRPEPSQSSALSGFGQGKTIRTNGFSLTNRTINGVYKPQVVGGVIPKDSTAVFEAKAPLLLDIAYAQFGFLNENLRGEGDSSVAYANVDCILDTVQFGGWVIGSIAVGGGPLRGTIEG